ncbi:MAG: 30S ribosomal protein S4 [Candidatus Margulisbacteria bacterium GWF2_35_9]|nr:MAG: 30S ribosomal protein S4 [Candidatus Margulisbacteria bacterium GWF2_35_9]
MGLYKGPSCKLCRREGVKLFLKSDKCETAKCPLGKRSYPPGHNGPLYRGKLSEYAIRLREKQKAKRYYYISESQFKKYYEVAFKQHGDTGEELLQLVESRLDSIVFRSGLVSTRRSARLMVKHGHFLVNKKKVDIPSFIVKVNDVVSVREKSIKKFEVQIEKAKTNKTSSWVTANYDTNEYVYNQIPKREDLDVPINEQLIVEFYSR